MNYVAVWMGYF